MLGSIKFYSEHKHAHWRVVRNCFLALTAELNSWAHRDKETFTIRPFTEQIRRPLLRNYGKISKLRNFWVLLPPLGSHAGVVLLPHPEASHIPGCVVLLRGEAESADHSTTGPGVIREEAAECWRLYIVKDPSAPPPKKYPTIIHHQGWQGKESPSQNGECVSSNNISINRTTGNKHTHHIKRELFAYNDKNEILS